MPWLALGADMKRRKFIALIGGAVAMPLVARAQQNERIRRIGVLLPFAKDSPEKARIEAFLKELQRLGWTDGRNLQIEYRWETSDLRKAAMELVALSPDVILASTTPAVSCNATGDPNSADRIYAGCRSGQCRLCCQSGEAWRQHYRVHGFRLRNRREMARTAQGDCSQRDACRGHSEIPLSTSSIGQFAAIQSAARLFRVEVSPLGGQDSKDIERTVTEFARGSNCGLISLASPLINNNRNLIISLAARHRLPATYPFPLLRRRRWLDLLWARPD